MVTRLPRDARRDQDAKLTPDDIGYVNAHGLRRRLATIHRDARSEEGVGDAREERADQFDEIHDRPFAGRRGWMEGGISVLALRDRFCRPPSIWKLSRP